MPDRNPTQGLVTTNGKEKSLVKNKDGVLCSVPDP
jgi:hypothetical protein